ncbi:MAG: hypothetical protein SGJ13_14985, partial [Actinomycetota bacterium]|nr:hypothetical protein [Actinomycetota bacterium]
MTGFRRLRALALPLAVALAIPAFPSDPVGAEVATTGPLISVAADGSATLTGASDSPSMSADGRYIAYDSAATQIVAGDTNNARDVFVRDTLTGANILVSKTDR